MLGLVRPKAVMPIHGEFRMLAAHARLAREAGVPGDVDRDRRERRRGRALDGRRARIVDHVEAGVTFVDGLGVGDVSDVALRDRRHLSEDGVLIVVATLRERRRRRPPELIARGFAESDDRCSTRCAARRSEIVAELLDDDITRDQAPAGAPPRRPRPARLRPHAAPADDPARSCRGMSRLAVTTATGPTCSSTTRQTPTRRDRLVAQLARLRGRRARVLPAARALGPRRRRAVRRRAAARRRCGEPPTGSRRRWPGSSGPLGRYLLELEPERAEGRSWYGVPGAAELRRLGARARPRGRPRRRACASTQAYLELAVFLRALEGLGDGGAHALDAGPLRALGRPLRPAREPARPRARGPARPRRLTEASPASGPRAPVHPSGRHVRRRPLRSVGDLPALD